TRRRVTADIAPAAAVSNRSLAPSANPTAQTSTTTTQRTKNSGELARNDVRSANWSNLPRRSSMRSAGCWSVRPMVVALTVVAARAARRPVLKPLGWGIPPTFSRRVSGRDGLRARRAARSGRALLTLGDHVGAQIVLVDPVIELHGVARTRRVVTHETPLVAADLGFHLRRSGQRPVAAQPAADELRLALGKGEDGGQRLPEADEGQVVEVGPEDPLVETQDVARSRDERGVEERERDLVAGGVDDRVHGLDASVGETDPV